jgi:hypothetical protein
MACALPLASISVSEPTSIYSSSSDSRSAKIEGSGSTEQLHSIAALAPSC